LYKLMLWLSGGLGNVKGSGDTSLRNRPEQPVHGSSSRLMLVAQWIFYYQAQNVAFDVAVDATRNCSRHSVVAYICSVTDGYIC
jgi:hypothetical protein